MGQAIAAGWVNTNVACITVIVIGAGAHEI